MQHTCFTICTFELKSELRVVLCGVHTLDTTGGNSSWIRFVHTALVCVGFGQCKLWPAISRWDVAWLCIHGAVWDTRQHLFLIYAGSVQATCVFFFFLSPSFFHFSLSFVYLWPVGSTSWVHVVEMAVACILLECHQHPVHAYTAQGSMRDVSGGRRYNCQADGRCGWTCTHNI